jgi:hypothetical protein
MLADLFAFLAAKEFYAGFRPQGAAPAPNPNPTPDPNPTPTPVPDPTPTPTPSPVGPDMTTHGLLGSAWATNLDYAGPPDYVMIGAPQVPFAYMPEIPGFPRTGVSRLWQGYFVALEDGTYVFDLNVKSAGYVLVDGKLATTPSPDREPDPGNHAQYPIQLTIDLKAGTHSFECGFCVQGAEHVFAFNVTLPGEKQRLAENFDFHPPLGWVAKQKPFTPPPAPTPVPGPPVVIPKQPDWSSYEAPIFGPDFKFFPASYDWYKDISNAPVDPNSPAMIAPLAAAIFHPEFGVGISGFPINILIPSDPMREVIFEVPGESDAGPYKIPISVVALENAGELAGGNNDVHYIGVDDDAKKVYELYNYAVIGNQLHAYSGVIWDMQQEPLRPKGWTSADASGGPMVQGLVRYEEALAGNVNHAIRVTVPTGRIRHAFVPPANHYVNGGKDATYIPMGARFRLKATADLSGLSPIATAIAKAAQRYGCIAVDGTNSSQMFFSGVPDHRWDDNDLGTLKKFKGADFEIVQMDTVTESV